eukprot:8983-Heterococcus_DN1.PRE.4
MTLLTEVLISDVIEQVLAVSNSSDSSTDTSLERCVYSFGYGEHGRLGIGSEVNITLCFTLHCGATTTDSATSPCMIPAAAFDGSPIAVAAGAQHSLILTDSGSVHACGSNDFG